MVNYQQISKSHKKTIPLINIHVISSQLTNFSDIQLLQWPLDSLNQSIEKAGQLQINICWLKHSYTPLNWIHHCPTESTDTSSEL